MTNMIPASLTSDDMGSPIRALHSLRGKQVTGIAAGLQILTMEWSIERHESCDGFLSLVVTHLARDVTIVADGDCSGILVSVMNGDALQSETSRCHSVAEAIDTIRAFAGDSGNPRAASTASSKQA